MSLIDEMGTFPLWYRRLAEEDMGEGATYDPPVDEDPTPFLCVNEPQYFDRGRDYAATGNGRVLTKTPFSTGDLVIRVLATEDTEEERQEVTQVNPLYEFDDSIDFYEVYL